MQEEETTIPQMVDDVRAGKMPRRGGIYSICFRTRRRQSTCARQWNGPPAAP